MSTAELQVSNAYKAGMRRLAAGVSIVTSRLGDQRAGLIATAVSSVIADPPTLLVCVNRSASAHDTIDAAGILAVNVLAIDDHDLARSFSDPSRRHERFLAGEWDSAATGSPVLKSAVVAFDCAIVQRIPYNTHTIFLGEVRAVRVGEAGCHPLVYLDQQFQRLGAL
ncbi:flavin reductase family protein [Variovorax ginsengisoli]|uniref:Flavin reductase n=1 Tax=Variovorax ginsengisoli TaxID=363844 RepID=A0ABT9S976_9BURK|nr:flavin reductase family protein [Variovorax ginsengisoli]MDP9900755.1 flavin reductase [Variovorax ginsengisoli]